MIWGCFSSFSGFGLIHINPSMNQFVYCGVLRKRWFFMLIIICLVYGHFNKTTTRHWSKSVKQWFETNQIKIIKRPAQLPGLNPIKNLWHQVEFFSKAQSPLQNLLKTRGMRSHNKKLISSSSLYRKDVPCS